MTITCRHSPFVSSSRRLRDGFRRRYWIQCWRCEKVWGPLRSKSSAWARARMIEVDLDTYAWSAPQNGDTADR